MVNDSLWLMVLDKRIWLYFSFFFPPDLFHLLNTQEFHVLKSKIMSLMYNFHKCTFAYDFSMLSGYSQNHVFHNNQSDRSTHSFRLTIVKELNKLMILSLQSTDCNKPFQYLTAVAGKLRCCNSKSTTVSALVKLTLMTLKSDYPRQYWFIQDKVSTTEIRIWIRDSRNPMEPVPLGNDSLSPPLLTVLYC